MPLWLRVLSFPFSLHPISPLNPSPTPTLPIALCLRTLSPFFSSLTNSPRPWLYYACAPCLLPHHLTAGPANPDRHVIRHAYNLRQGGPGHHPAALHDHLRRPRLAHARRLGDHTCRLHSAVNSLGWEGQRVLVLCDRTLPTLRSPQHKATPYLPTLSRTSTVTS